MESYRLGSKATERGTLEGTMCSGRKSMMHDDRSRKPLTNHNHARLALWRVIREYQFDSPSITALLPGLELSRDGPKSRAGLTGSFISVPIFQNLREEGFEPSRPCGHTVLSRARLPVPPPARDSILQKRGQSPFLTLNFQAGR